MIIEVDVIDDLSECLIANLSSEIHRDDPILRLLLLSEELCEVLRLICNYALMTLHLDIRDNNLLLLPPIPFINLHWIAWWYVLLLGLRR